VGVVGGFGAVGFSGGGVVGGGVGLGGGGGGVVGGFFWGFGGGVVGPGGGVGGGGGGGRFFLRYLPRPLIPRKAGQCLFFSSFYSSDFGGLALVAGDPLFFFSEILRPALLICCPFVLPKLNVVSL